MKHILILSIHTLLFITASTCGGPSEVQSSGSDFILSSIAIKDHILLDEYKCEEKRNEIQNSIPLSWTGVPKGTKSLAVVMRHYPHSDDKTEVNSYLLLWGIDPSVTEIPYAKAGDGEWYMGANKDKTAISYTSPCSPSPGAHEYTILLYALSETPSVLPDSSSVQVNYETMMDAISTVDIIDTAVLTFNDVN